MVRDNPTREDLEACLRDARAECRIYRDLHGAESVDEYIDTADDPVLRDVLGWEEAEQRAQWTGDALDFFDRFDQIQRASGDVVGRQISGAEAERRLVDADGL